MSNEQIIKELRGHGVPDVFMSDALSIVAKRMASPHNESLSTAISYVINFLRRTQLI